VPGNTVPEVIERSRWHAFSAIAAGPQAPDTPSKSSSRSLRHTGLPSVSGQRRRKNTFSTPLPDMRMILAALSERAPAESRKCCAMRTDHETTNRHYPWQRKPSSTSSIWPVQQLHRAAPAAVSDANAQLLTRSVIAVIRKTKATSPELRSIMRSRVRVAPAERPFGIKCRLSCRDGERGFLLIEVLIASLIAVAAITAILHAATGGIVSSRVAGRVDEAVARANSHLATLSALPLVESDRQGDESAGYHWHVRVVSAGTVHPSNVLTATPAGAITLYRISVSISWTESGHRRAVQLDSARLSSAA